MEMEEVPSATDWTSDWTSDGASAEAEGEETTVQ